MMIRPLTTLLLLLSIQASLSAQDLQFSYQSGLTGQVKHIIPIEGSNLMIVAAGDGVLIAWNAETNKILQRVRTSHEELYDMAYAASQHKLFVSGEHGIDVYDVTDLLTRHELKYLFTARLKNITAMYWNGTKDYLLAAGSSDTIRKFNSINDLQKGSAAITFKTGLSHPFAIKEIGGDLCVLSTQQQVMVRLADHKQLFASSYYNTGMYGHSFNEKDSAVYLPLESGAIQLSYKNRKFTAIPVLPETNEERLLTLSATTDKTGNTYFGNNDGDIFLVSPNGEKKSIWKYGSSFTSLFAKDSLLYAGDFFGNIFVVNPRNGTLIAELNEDPTPVLNGVYLNDRTIVSTHFGTRGVAIKFWDIATASLQQSFNIPTYVVNNVHFTPGGDSVITLHSDGGMLLFGKIDNVYRMDTLKRSEVAFFYGAFLNTFDTDLRSQRESNNKILQDLLGRRGVIPILTNGGDDTYELNVVHHLEVPELCKKGKMPDGYRIPVAYLAASGLGEESKEWDMMDKDLYYTKACASETFDRFREWTKKYNIDSIKSLGFYRLVKGIDTIPDLFYIADVSTDSHYVTDMFLFRERPKYIDMSKMPQKMLMFFTDSVLVWENTSKKFRTIFTGLKEFDFNYDFTDQFLVFGDGPGNTISLYNTNAAKKGAVKFIGFGENNFLVHQPDGYYRTAGRSNRLNVKMNEQPVSFNSFDLVYNRPDIVMKRIGLADSLLVQAFRNAAIKRLRRSGIMSDSLYRINRVPEAVIANKQQIGYAQSSQLELKLNARQTTAPLQQLNVWVNDVPLYGKKGITFTQPLAFFDTSIVIDLSPGDNHIEFSVTSADHIESNRESLNVYANITMPEKVYFIGIGIDHFLQSKYDLRYSVKDIRDLASKLKERYGDKITIDTLFDSDVTLERIASLKDRIAEAGINDKVIVSYSGHGVLDKNFNYYLSTHNMNFDVPSEGGIPYELIENLVDSTRCRKKIMLIDACHSGELDREEIDRIENISKSLDTLGTKADTLNKSTITVKKKVGMQNSFQLMQELFIDVSRGTGATIISAAGGLQYAQERGDLKNGVFTYSIINAFNSNKKLTVSQLKKLVTESVERLTNGLQKPTSRNETTGFDWVIW